MNKHCFLQKVSTFMVLTLLFVFQTSFSQTDKSIEKLYRKISAAQSGYIRLAHSYTWLTAPEDTIREDCEIYFYKTSEHVNYVIKNQTYSDIICNIGKTALAGNSKYTNSISFPYQQISKMVDYAGLFIATDLLKYLFLDNNEKSQISCQTPQINIHNKRVVSRYQDMVVLPDGEPSGETEVFFIEIEYNPKTLSMEQIEVRSQFVKYSNIHIIEFQSCEYYQDIKLFIIDTIQNCFDRLMEWEIQGREQKALRRDSVFHAQWIDSLLSTGWGQGTVMQKEEEDNTNKTFTAFSLPLLNGDTLHSDSIHARFLLLDFWYIGCFPCILLTKELVALDSVINDDWVKIVGINCTDKDVNKIKIHDEKFGVKYDVVYHGIDYANQFFRFCGGGFPQLYLIDMKTKQIIWHSCGYYKGITKDLEKMIVF